MKNLAVFLVGLCMAFSVFAQVVSVKGVGTVPYTGNVFVDADKVAAVQRAKLKAVERYFAENGESESANFDAVAPYIEANLDKFILSDVITDEKDEKALKRYSVAIKVEINVSKLRNELKKASAAGNPAAGNATAAGKSQLAYLFIAREVSSSRSFDDRVVKRVEAEGTQSSLKTNVKRGSEGESIGANKISTNASVTQNGRNNFNESLKIETGGSVTRKADEASYRLLPMDDKKSSITKAFTNGGFKAADSALILSDKETLAVNNDYSKGSDLSPSTIKMVAAKMKAAGVSYLVIATLDIGAYIQDPATGQQRANVSVSGRILDLNSAIPSEAASVTPQQYAGIGLDNATASASALKKAAESAARELVSSLNAAGIR